MSAFVDAVVPTAFAVMTLLYVVLLGDAASGVTRLVKMAVVARKPHRSEKEELLLTRRVELLSSVTLVPVTVVLALLATLRPGNQLLGTGVWLVVLIAVAGVALVWAGAVLPTMVLIRHQPPDSADGP